MSQPPEHPQQPFGSPPPGRPGPPPPGQPGPPVNKKVPAYLGVAALTLLLLGTAIWLFTTTGNDNVPVSDLARGDCLVSADVAIESASVDDVSIVECDQTHDGQVVATASAVDEDPTDACVQAISDEGTSVASLSVKGRLVKPLSDGEDVACLVVGSDLEGTVLE